jgi:type VI protein secretion system component VasK
MNLIPFFLADEDIDAVLASWRKADPGNRERMLIFGAIGMVTLLAMAWAVFLRKRRHRRRELHHSHSHSSRPAEVAKAPAAGDAAALPEKRRHRRRSRRKHRARNPTLAETGGLPPIREEDPPEPQT